MQTQTATIGGHSFLLRDVHDTSAKLSDQHRKELSVILSGFRSIRGDRRAHIDYVTLPISTGKRFYDVLTREGVYTLEELVVKRGSAFVYEEIIRQNIEEGIAYVDALTREDSRLQIAPAVFEAKALGWSDHVYMSLWYRVIAEFAGRHKVAPYWSYTFGGVREMFFSFLLQFRCVRRYNLVPAIDEYGLENFLPGMADDEVMTELEKMWAIRIYDKVGEVTLPAALTECTRTIAELHARGFPVEHFFDLSWKMMQIPFFSPLLGDSKMCVYEDPGYMEARTDLYRLRERIASGKAH